MALRRLAVFAAALALGCPGPEESGPSAAPPAASRAPRIVSLTPLATRFLVELGVAPQLVAVDAVSRGLQGVDDMQVATLETAYHFDPDLVLLPALPDDVRSLSVLEGVGARVIQFAPHDLEDVFALCRSVAGPLVGEDAATAFERRIARPLSLIAGEASPDDRPRILALVSIDPPEIAGGHSFETDLIEIAGGSSITHGSDDNRRPIDTAGLESLAPDRVVVMTSQPLSAADEDRALRLVDGVAPVDFFQFERETFWLDEPADDAARLRASFLAAGLAGP